jgi:hypothetical protein
LGGGATTIIEKQKISKKKKNKQGEREGELNTVRCKKLGIYV